MNRRAFLASVPVAVVAASALGREPKIDTRAELHRALRYLHNVRTGEVIWTRERWYADTTDVDISRGASVGSR